MEVATGSADDAPRSRLLGALALAWLAVSSASIVTVYARPVPPLAIAAARTGITAGVWLLLGARVLGPTWRTLRADRSSRGWLAVSGVLLAAHFALWITSLSYTTVAHATVLVALQPLFAGLFGRVLGDRATWRLYAGIALALVGTAILTGAGSRAAPESAPGATAGAGEVASFFGDTLAVLAAAAAAAYLLAGRHVGARVPLAGALAFVNGVAFLALAPFALVFAGGAGALAIEGEDLLALLWLGLVPGLVGHGLLNWTARHMQVHAVSVAVLLEPAGATLLAYLLLDQAVTPAELAGGGLLIASAWLSLGKET